MYFKGLDKVPKGGYSVIMHDPIFPKPSKGGVYTISIHPDGHFSVDYGPKGTQNFHASIRLDMVMQILLFRDLLREAGYVPTEESATFRSMSGGELKVFK